MDGKTKRQASKAARREQYDPKFVTGFVEPVDRLIYELTKTVNHLPPPTWRRVRFAVTEAEWEMLREYCLKRDSRWHGRIRDIPLVIEDKPLDPPCYVEGVVRAMDVDI